MHLFCVSWCVCGRQSPNLNPIADVAITRGGIWGLGSPLYICSSCVESYQRPVEWSCCWECMEACFNFTFLAWFTVKELYTMSYFKNRCDIHTENLGFWNLLSEIVILESTVKMHKNRIIAKLTITEKWFIITIFETGLLPFKITITCGNTSDHDEPFPPLHCAIMWTV